MKLRQKLWAQYAVWMLAESAVVVAVIFVLTMLGGALGWLSTPPLPKVIPWLVAGFAALAWLLHWVDDRANAAIDRLTDHLLGDGEE